MENEFEIFLSESAKKNLEKLKRDKGLQRAYKAICKCLLWERLDLRHQSLHTHPFHEKSGPNGEKIFESYPQNRTPGAYRIFWFYGPETKQISVVEISHHE